MTTPGQPPTDTAGPVTESARITSLDLIRGVAVLGILLMNAVSFKLGQVPYWNLSAGGSETWLDWSVGIFGEIFVDQKFMGLFSLLFGAGMMLFIDRASNRERRPVLLNLWRNGLLLVIGVLHFLLWDGDILIAYALASLFLIALRKLPARALIVLGVLIFCCPSPTASGCSPSPTLPTLTWPVSGRNRERKSRNAWAWVCCSDTSCVGWA